MNRFCFTLGLAGLIALLTTFSLTRSPQVDAKPVVASPLDLVPADAGLVAHAKAADVWKLPLIAELRKKFGKGAEDFLAKIVAEGGIAPDSVDTVTFHYPKLPQGPGDEQLFCVQVVTKVPYEAEKLLPGLRPKGEMAKGNAIPLVGDFVLHLISEKHFAVAHKSLTESLLKGAPAKEGTHANLLKVAREGKHTIVFGFDPSALPNEIFTAAPPELQPFLPLLKSKSIYATGDASETLKLQVHFATDSDEASTEAERALKLAVQLAETNLAEVMKQEGNPELTEMKPLIADLVQSFQKAKVTRESNRVSGELSMKLDSRKVEVIAKSFLRVGDASERATSSNNLKQIVLAMHNFESTSQTFPAASICDKKGKALLSWRVAILPCIEQQELYKEFKLDEPWDSDHNKKLIGKMPKIYMNPGSPQKDGDGKTQYRVFVGNDAAFDYVQGAGIRTFTDGTSNTMLVCEAKEAVVWTKPEEIEWDPKKPILPLLFFRDNAVCMIAMADGSVRAVSIKVSEKTLKNLIQKGDGNVVGDDF
jgi:Protein of unknown function (DUF1559)